jgi:hypothetical protein
MSLSILPARDFCGLVIVLCWGLSGAIAAAQQLGLPDALILGLNPIRFRPPLRGASGRVAAPRAKAPGLLWSPFGGSAALRILTHMGRSPKVNASRDGLVLTFDNALT